MAIRTTPDAVIDVLRNGSEGGDYDDDNEPSLDGYIDAASAITDRVAACAIKKNLSLSTTELELIERWVAAHNYCMSDQTYASKNTTQASASFKGQTGKGLEITNYGQTALRLDYSGCLSAIDKRQFAGVSWLGKPPSTQIPYEQRS